MSALVTKLRKLKMEYLITTGFLQEKKYENEDTTKISCRMAHLLAKQGKPVAVILLSSVSLH